MDVYSRRILDWIFQSSIRKIDVLKIISRIDLTHDLKGVTVRNDNGSQFIANKVRHYLRTLEANQEFTHIATPQENSYIEAFHSIIDREVIQRFDFEGYYEAKLSFAAYMDFYNTKRQHGSLKIKSPIYCWNEYYISLLTDTPQLAQVSEDMSRVSGCEDTVLALDMYGDTATFPDRMMNENNSKEVLRSFDNIVQVIGGKDKTDKDEFKYVLLACQLIFFLTFIGFLINGINSLKLNTDNKWKGKVYFSLVFWSV